MIGIIDYGLGNLASIANALKKLEVSHQISSDIAVLRKTEGLILPGVGAAGQGMENLRALGLDRFIGEQAKSRKSMLGICLGMQLMLSFSEEDNVPCLDLIKGQVKQFKTTLKVPQIGWNSVKNNNQPRIMKNITNNSYFYFVNSYICLPLDKSITSATTDYDGNFCSVFERDTLYGTQFHPEKSGDMGLQLLKNFSLLCK